MGGRSGCAVNCYSRLTLLLKVNLMKEDNMPSPGPAKSPASLKPWRYIYLLVLVSAVTIISTLYFFSAYFSS
jgi:hypothetical protein